MNPAPISPGWALVATFLLWGLAGGRWSRFGSFMHGPATILRHLRGQSAADELHHVGHIPLGALSVLAMLGLLAVQVACGLVAEDEIAKSRKFAIESFAESMLPVIDSLEAGLTIKDATLEQIREGSQATLRQLMSALERNKVVQINPVAGDRFDPHQHQAISVAPSDQEANTVVNVLQKGYLIAERILRPALVVVAGPK